MFENKQGAYNTNLRSFIAHHVRIAAAPERPRAATKGKNMRKCIDSLAA